MLIFLTGFPGSGKSFLGKQVATLMKYNFIDTDYLIEQQMGMPVRDIFNKYGEIFFRDRESEVLKSLSKNKNSLIAVGGGLPCFNKNMEWMQDHGLTVYLEASAAFLFHRLMKEKDIRPLIGNLTDVELMIYIIETLSARKAFYEMAEIKVNAETCSAAKLFSAIKDKKQDRF